MHDAGSLPGILELPGRPDHVPRRELLCCFTDAMCLFASNINNEELAKVVMYQLRQLVLEVGGHLNEPELWVDIIE